MIKRFSYNVALVMLLSAAIFAQDLDWQELQPGLSLRKFNGTDQSPRAITVLRIDPEQFEFRLLCQSELGGANRRIRNWAGDFGLTAAINAGMFQEDLSTSVGYLKNQKHVNNPSVNKNQTIFAFNPVDSTRQRALIIDRTCDDFDDLKTEYACFLQSIRMLSCKQRNVWAKQPTRWPMSVLASDNAGNILFIYSAIPHRVHDLINMLVALPLNIYNAMYLEGGPVAGLYLSGNVDAREGGEESSEPLDLGGSGAIPNVIGIVPTSKK